MSAAPASAELSDEIQVYTDDINAAGKAGLELHVNLTAKGRSVADYLGEAVPQHGLRLTPEFSYGLTSSLEAGVYLPVNRDASGNTELAGAKLRLKWVPLRAAEEGGWFLGANGELSNLKQKFSESRSGFELRLMGGWKNPDWLLAMNPVVAWNLSEGFRGQPPGLSLSAKAARRIGEGLSIGAEYYSDLGSTARVLPWREQGNTLYGAVDLEFKGWDINIGIGRGLTPSADDLTLKAIIGFPF